MEPKAAGQRLADVDATALGAQNPSSVTRPVASGVVSARSHDITTIGAEARSELDFDDFYREHAHRINHALRLTLRDPELAEDALNEAMARALQRWKRVAYFDNPEGWVYRVAMNWALSWLRRRRRERDRPVALSAPTAELEVEDGELSWALEQLSIEHRTVVVCRFMLDWSVDQTAEALDVPVGTVKSRLSRALENIRSLLAAVDPATNETHTNGGSE